MGGARAHFAIAGSEVSAQGGVRQGAGFDGMKGQRVRYQLDETGLVAGAEHLVRSEPQRQTRLLQQPQTRPSAAAKRANGTAQFGIAPAKLSVSEVTEESRLQCCTRGEASTV